MTWWYWDFTILRHFDKIYDSSNRKDLDFLRDKCTNIFLQAVWKISNFLDDKNNIKRTIPIKNSFYIKTKIKSILYLISPKLYLYIHKFFCKGEK